MEHFFGEITMKNIKKIWEKNQIAKADREKYASME